MYLHKIINLNNEYNLLIINFLTLLVITKKSKFNTVICILV